MESKNEVKIMKLYCEHDYVMTDGEISFTSGNSYEFTYLDDEYYVAIDDQGASHQMHVTDLLPNFTYFRK